MNLEVKLPDDYFDIVFNEIKNNRTIFDIVFSFLIKKVECADGLFILLSKLKRDKKIEIIKNKIIFIDSIDENYKNELKKYFDERIEKLRKKIFFSPLEISKFYQCERRFFLEKYLKLKTKKDEKSKEGEKIHKLIKFFLENYLRKNIDEIIEELKKNEKNIKEEYKDYLNFLNNFLKKNKFSTVFSERRFISLEKSLISSSDLICVKDGKIFPVEIKMSFRKNKATLLQLIGEAIVLERYARKKVDYVFLIGLKNKKIGKIKIDEKLKESFEKYRRKIIKVILSNKIPNIKEITIKKGICNYCHVKDMCDEIEKIRKYLKGS